MADYRQSESNGSDAGDGIIVAFRTLQVARDAVDLAGGDTLTIEDATLVSPSRGTIFKTHGSTTYKGVAGPIQYIGASVDITHGTTSKIDLNALTQDSANAQCQDATAGKIDNWSSTLGIENTDDQRHGKACLELPGSGTSDRADYTFSCPSHPCRINTVTQNSMAVNTRCRIQDPGNSVFVDDNGDFVVGSQNLRIPSAQNAYGERQFSDSSIVDAVTFTINPNVTGLDNNLSVQFHPNTSGNRVLVQSITPEFDWTWIDLGSGLFKCYLFGTSGNNALAKSSKVDFFMSGGDALELILRRTVYGDLEPGECYWDLAGTEEDLNARTMYYQLAAGEVFADLHFEFYPYLNCFEITDDPTIQNIGLFGTVDLGIIISGGSADPLLDGLHILNTNGHCIKSTGAGTDFTLQDSELERANNTVSEGDPARSTNGGSKYYGAPDLVLITDSSHGNVNRIDGHDGGDDGLQVDDGGSVDSDSSNWWANNSAAFAANDGAGVYHLKNSNFISIISKFKPNIIQHTQTFHDANTTAVASTIDNCNILKAREAGTVAIFIQDGTLLEVNTSLAFGGTVDPDFLAPGGGGTGGEEDDPKFVDIENDDFHLLASSPGANTATAPAPTGGDLNGVAFPANFPLGAFAFTAGKPFIITPYLDLFNDNGDVISVDFSPNIMGESSFDAIGLPDGLTINQDTGVVTGTITQNGNYFVTVTATNGVGDLAPPALFNWFVGAQAQQFRKLSQVGSNGNWYSYKELGLTIAEMDAGYFSNQYVASILKTDDILSVTGSDGAKMYQVTVIAETRTVTLTLSLTFT